MSSIPCPDECGRVYESIKASLLCQCAALTPYGYPRDGAYELGNN